MLFKPEDLSYGYDPIQEAANILNESVYLNESESILSPMAVPVVENARIGACVVAFDDVERLAEDHGVDYIDAMVGIAEANQISMDHLAVSVPEWKIIADPEIVNELSNVVVAPISSQNPVYQFCEACVDLALKENDESYIDLFVDLALGEATVEDNGRYVFGAEEGSDQKRKEKEASDKAAKAATMAGLGNPRANANTFGSGGGRSDTPEEHEAAIKKLEQGKISKVLNAVKKYTYTVPKQKISQALAYLKKQYTKLKTWAEGKGEGQDPNKRNIAQKFVGLIVKAIDKLTGLLSSKKDEEKKAS